MRDREREVRVLEHGQREQQRKHERELREKDEDLAAVAARLARAEEKAQQPRP